MKNLLIKKRRAIRLSVFLAVTILSSFIFVPTMPALAVKASILNLDLSQGLLKCSFSCDQEYVVLSFTAPKENSRRVIHVFDGKANALIELQCAYNKGDTITVILTAMNGHNIAKKTIRTNSAWNPDLRQDVPSKTNKSNKTSKLQNLKMIPSSGGVHISFDGPGYSQMLLYYSGAYVKGEHVLYPDEKGHFDYVLKTPGLYQSSRVRIRLRPSAGKADLCDQYCQTAYRLKAKVTKPAPNGRLKGITVCVDPGHQEIAKSYKQQLAPNIEKIVPNGGGMASGITTHRRESIVVLEIAFVLRDELLRQGANVVMTREIQETHVTNFERCDIAESAGADFMLRLHCDEVASNISRIAVYIPSNSSYARKAATKEEYKAMAKALNRAMRQACGYKDDNGQSVCLTDNFVGNNWAKMPCFLVEMGNMGNFRDDLLLSTPDYQQALAEGMAQGIYDMSVMRGLLKTNNR